MLTVKELAIKADAPAHVVRYYTQIGLLKPTKSAQNGYRQFVQTDIARLRFIRMAKHLGFTLKEIREITGNAQKGESPCQDVRRIVEDRIEENRVKIREMQQLQNRMEKALLLWEEMPNGMPDGNSICHLIESFDSK